MKLFFCIGVVLLLCFMVVLVVFDFCEWVKSDIQQKIINNGVLEIVFSLVIVLNDQVDQFGVQVVGYCVNDIFKIIYMCNSDSFVENDVQ